MTRRKQSRGDCVFCGREMAKSGLTRHLKTCEKRKEAIRTADEEKKGEKQSLYHLQIQDVYLTDFWLHLEMNGSAIMEDLDYYLRTIWLECCVHLSRFFEDGMGSEDIPMDHKVDQELKPGDELTHVYDFGTSSETLIRVLDAREGWPLTEHPVYLMARNHMPPDVCSECGETAGWYCRECNIENGEWVNLCRKHAEAHTHHEYGDPYPLVNSPRLGMCGYTGPAKPPY